MSEAVTKPSNAVPSVAPHPFNQALADVALRTPDCVDFHVYSSILSQASPFFADMFSLPQPQTDLQGRGAAPSRPVIDVAEDSKTLEGLLRLCYPIGKPAWDEVEHIVPIVKAAMKYDMEWPMKLLTRDLLDMIPHLPMRVWAVACRTGLEAVAHEAAAEIRKQAKGADTLSSVVDFLQKMLEQDGLLKVLDGVCAGHYFRLFDFLHLSEDGPAPKPMLLSPPLDSKQHPATPDVLSTVSLKLTPSLLVGTPAFVPRSPAPDVILRGLDGRHIPAHRLVLSLHSAIFDSITASSNEFRSLLVSGNGKRAKKVPRRIIHSLPVITIRDVDHHTLLALIQACYQGEDSLPSDLSRLAAVLVAAEKYEMTQIVQFAKRRWEQMAEYNPLEAYLIAFEYKLDAYARTAALSVLKKPIARHYTQFMEEASALAYHRLLVYYRSCGGAVRDRFNQALTDWQADIVSMPRYDDRCRSYSDTKPVHGWLTIFLQESANRADNDGPGSDWGITTHALLQQACSSDTGDFWPYNVEARCKLLSRTLLKLGSALPQAITDAIADVKLET